MGALSMAWKAVLTLGENCVTGTCHWQTTCKNILIRELIALKQVTETEVDNLFSEVERILEFYTKAGESDALQEKLVKAAILQNLPDKPGFPLHHFPRKSFHLPDHLRIPSLFLTQSVDCSTFDDAPFYAYQYFLSSFVYTEPYPR